MSIDLNADLGEGMDDGAILPFITSANIACGMHAGDPDTMQRTVALALARGVQLGAHPGYPDRKNFGRVPVEMSLAAVRNLVLYQIAALDGFARAHGSALSHVKPHGALYNQAADDLDLALAIADSVRDFRRDLILVGLAGSKLIQAGKERGLAVAEEAFADRRYLPNGMLVPRSRPGAVLSDPEEAAAQAIQIARDRNVTAEDGSRISLRADTLCLHGDTPNAKSVAEMIRMRFAAELIPVAPLAQSRARP